MPERALQQLQHRESGGLQEACLLCHGGRKLAPGNGPMVTEGGRNPVYRPQSTGSIVGLKEPWEDVGGQVPASGQALEDDSAPARSRVSGLTFGWGLLAHGTCAPQMKRVPESQTEAGQHGSFLIMLDLFSS